MSFRAARWAKCQYNAKRAMQLISYFKCYFPKMFPQLFFSDENYKYTYKHSMLLERINMIEWEM